MKAVLPTAVLAAIPGAALAHPGISSGFTHPISGLDHFLMITSVGLMAAMIGGRTVWLLPLSFIAVMLLGGILGSNGTALPAIELAIATSVVLIGCLIVAGGNVPLRATAGLVAAFGLFHGHAHGAEMPIDSGVLGYTAGFIAATAALLGLGIMLGLATRMAGKLTSNRVAHVAGSMVAVLGLGILAGAI